VLWRCYDSERDKAPDTLKSDAMNHARRFWIGVFAQLVLLAFLAVALAKSAVSGRHLLIAALIWFVAVLAWNQLGPSSFFLSLGRRNVTKMTLVFAFGCFYQLFIFGWLAPLAIGIYRVALRQ
jgi:hypothetical protein